MSEKGLKSGDDSSAPIIIKRKAGGGHGGHHGGAWKIAYADFVTAMMAFFLLMWLLGSTTKGDLNGVSEYFNTPLSTALNGGNRSGAATSVLEGGALALQNSKPAEANNGAGKRASRDKISVLQNSQRAEQLKQDAQRLMALKDKLASLIEQNPKLNAFKNQIKIDITSEGLRIQIIDAQNRPMFNSGSSTLEPYTKDILDPIGVVLNDVPNHVSIAGHTDSQTYSGGDAGYSNWELSSERANAARRELVSGGMKADKVLMVRGLADVLPLVAGDPAAPGNRRISIVVLNQETEEAFFRDGGRTDVSDATQAASAVDASGTPVANPDAGSSASPATTLAPAKAP